MQTPVCTTRPFLKAVTTPTNDRPLRSRALPVHPWRHLQKVVVEVVTASGNGDIPTQKRVSASVYIASPRRRHHRRRSSNDGCTAHPPKCAQKCAQTRASSRVLLRKACDAFKEAEFVNSGIRQCSTCVPSCFGDMCALFVLKSASPFCCNGPDTYNRSQPPCSRKCAQACAQQEAFPW